MPVAPPAPRITAVYCSFGSSVATIADSQIIARRNRARLDFSLLRAAPVVVARDRLASPLKSSSVGSCRPMPTSPRDGPIARRMTFFGSLPVTIRPPISAFSSVPTSMRVEMFASRADGEGVGSCAIAGATATIDGSSVSRARRINSGESIKRQNAWLHRA